MLAFLALACASSEQSTVTSDQLPPEELEKLKDTAWTNLTESLNGPQFSKDTLTIKQIQAVKGRNPEIAKEEVQIQGSLAGIGEASTREFSANFTLTLDKDSSLRTGTKLDITIYRGENAGDVVRPYPSNPRITEVRDPQDMQKRFEDITGMLTKVLKIPEKQPFIPEQDWNGLATFVSGEHRIGYGLFISAREIDGKSVTVDVTEGMLVDNQAWGNSQRRYDVIPGKISFKELLGVALRDLKKPRAAVAYTGGFRHVKDAPAAEYIRQLGEKYLPNQAAQVNGR